MPPFGRVGLTQRRQPDYLLYGDWKALGVVEAKKEGDTLTGVETRFTGSHRRIPRKYLMAFKERTDAAREDALRTLTEEAQELHMGY